QHTCIPCGSTPPNYQNHKYTSAQFSSGWLPLRRIQFGYLEAKIKTSDIYGMFPAFWTWAQVGNAGDSNYDYDEIDIFELIPGAKKNVGLHDKNVMTSNIHIDMNSTSPPYIHDYKEDEINDYTNFHIYAIEWSP